MRKILCQNCEPKRVFAHQLDDATIDIVRQDQRFTVIGTDYTIYGTNPQGSGKTVLIVKGGKLVEDDIDFKVDESGNKPDEPKKDDTDGKQDPTPED